MQKVEQAENLSAAKTAAEEEVRKRAQSHNLPGAVLEFLMRRAGTVVSKLEIVSAVWDMAYDGDLNIVEVYVRRLRAKVDEPFGVHSIETVRGAGYRLAREGH